MPDPIRFAPTGPNGWSALPDQPLEHAELLKGSPVGLDHAEAGGAQAGVDADDPHQGSSARHRRPAMTLARSAR